MLSKSNGDLLSHLGKHEPGNCVFSVVLGIHQDHPRRRIEIKFCVVAHLQEVVPRFEFHQSRLSGFGAVGDRNLPFAIDLAKSVGNGQINGKGQISTPNSSKTA